MNHSTLYTLDTMRAGRSPYAGILGPYVQMHKEGAVKMEKRRSIWDCCGYGPADLLQVWKTESTLKLLLRDSAGEKAEAVYHGCIYHRLGPQTSGIHLSEVRRVSVRELLEDPRCVSVLALRKNSANVAQMLHDWENAGLSFYLHKGNAAYMEFLVVCQSMEYRQTGN